MDLEGLSVICNGLVTPEEDDYGEIISYSKNEFCLDNLKDLQRFLRRDDPQTRDVFKQVCKWNTVARDLVPIIEHFQDDKVLVTSAVKVLVFLTMPIEPTSDNISQQIDYLWELKASLTRSDTIAVIVSLLEAPLENLECNAFSEDDWKLVQLVLTLFRNILAIQEISVQQKASGQATQYLSLRDRFLELLFSENVMDLILALTQHVGGSHGYLRQDNLLFLEIFHYIFLGQEPDLIVKASQKVTKVDEDVKSSVNSLRSLMDEEKDKRRLARLHVLDRHSQFSGAFTRIAVDGSKSLLMGNPSKTSRERMLKPHTVHRGPIKRIVGDCGRLTSSTERILERLYDFINQLLSGGYNELMQSVRKDIEKEHPAIQNNDIVVFFQVAQFVTGFQRQKFLLQKKPNVETDAPHILSNKYVDNTLFQGDICGPIASTMNEAMFLLVISKWRSAFEGLKETNDYKSLSAAGSLMKNMIRMLDLVLRLLPDDSKEPQTARILLYKLFYDQTDQGLTQFLLTQIKSFNTHKQSKSDLADLVEMVHVVVRLMENLQERGTLRVARKAKRGRKKKVLNNKKASMDETSGDNIVNPHTDAGDHPTNQHTDAADHPTKPYADAGDHPINTHNDAVNPVIPHDGDGDLYSKFPSDPSILQEEPCVNSGSDGKGESFLSNQIDESRPTDAADAGDDLSMASKELFLNTDSDGKTESNCVSNHIDELVIPPTDTGNAADDLSISSKELFGDSGPDGKVDVSNQNDELGKPLTDTVGAGDGLTHITNKDDSSKPDGLQIDTDDSSEDDLPAVTNEVDFQVSSFISTFASNTIIQNVCWLLRFYKNNSVSTNHYIICMLRRICDDLELAPMLYQLSLLTIFYEILAEQKSSKCKEHENIVAFLSDLVRRMMRKMKAQPLLFVEILFWKTRRECHFINSETMINELGELKKETRNWGTADKEKDVPSYGFGGAHRSIADALGEDEADVIISEPPYTATYQKGEDQYGAKRQKETSLGDADDMRASNSESDVDGQHLDSVDSQNELSSAKNKSHQDSKRKKRLVFDEELETDLERLYEKFKGEKKCSHIIAHELIETGRTLTAAQVSRKLKQLGFYVPPKRKLPESSKPSKNADDEDLHVDERTNKSDDETLSVLRKRGEDKYGAKRQKVTSVDNADDVNGDVEGEHLDSVDSQNELSSGKQKSHQDSKRKKRLVFDQELETDIKRLYEKFKGEKRCSHIIAHELIETGKTLTAAQVSRKLKQLGLYVPQIRKLSKSGKPSKHADDDLHVDEGANKSDDETLSVLKKRSKTNTKPNVLSKDTLNNSNGKTKRISEDNDSDDEVLSSLFVKTGKRRVSSVPVEKPPTSSSIEETITENDSAVQVEVPEDANKSDGPTSSTKLASPHGENLNKPNLDEGALSDSITKSGTQKGGASIDSIDDERDEEMHDSEVHELDDSEDEVTPVAPNKPVVRRKLKMVLDLEDDE